MTRYSTFVLLLALAQLVRAADWPQWRGPTRDGVVAGSSWPNRLDDNSFKSIWSCKLGPGYSGPIVHAGKVFVAESLDEKEESVRAFELATGKQLWQARWPGHVSVVFIAKPNGDWIKATPACDGECLYVVGMQDVLVCLEVESGRERWRVDFTELLKTPIPQFGSVSSPLVVGEHVYVQAAGSFLKLDKKTGKLVWRTLKTDAKMQDNPFASPVLATLAGKRQLVVQSRKLLAGVDEDNGEVLWSIPVPAFQDTNVLTPLVHRDQIFTSSYGGGSFLVEIRKTGDKFEVQQRWRSKPQGYMSSPVRVGEHLYHHLRNQRFCCLSLADGSEKWTTDPFGKYWSMAVQGDKILALDQTGDLRLIRANPDKFELLGKMHVTDATSWAHLAIVEDLVLIRALDGLTVYRWK